MAMLYFVLDLRSLPPPLLRDLKQSLLQLGNYYATSSSTGCNGGSKPLPDRIGLCYVYRDRISCADEIKIAYNPQRDFNLRDFHHSLNALPMDAFSPEFKDIRTLYQKLADILDGKFVHAQEFHDKSVTGKVILMFSCLVESLDSRTVQALMDAANRSILVEFVLMHQPSNHFNDITLNNGSFIEQIRPLRNCSFQAHVPDKQSLAALAKQWFLELKDHTKEPIRARFILESNLNSTANQITCNLCPYYYPIIDSFTFCQTCRCHGIPLDEKLTHQAKLSLVCPLTMEALRDFDMADNSMKVGEQTILYMPSFRDSQKLLQVSSTVNFNVIQRTSLRTLSEGFIMGATYVAVPTLHNSDGSDGSEQDSQAFEAVCCALHGLDQGLVCTSNCNIETLMETSIQCYYILLPSDRGLMLLRRLLAAEELLPIPDVRKVNIPADEEVERIVQCLKKIELSDYNPMQHERGFHQKLNLLVKQSLRFGAILPETKEAISESKLNSSLEAAGSEKAVDINIAGDNRPGGDIRIGENIAKSSNTEEWEQVIVAEFGGTHSPTFTSRPKLDKLLLSPSHRNRQLDAKTSRILERLELPRQLKRKSPFPTISSTVPDACTPAKKPLVPYKQTHTVEQGTMSSQPMKPNFQRSKRKTNTLTA